MYHGEIQQQHFHDQPRRDIPVHPPQSAAARIGRGLGLIQIDVLR
jgi:hypothetical protein